jgi:hypothetical protein
MADAINRKNQREKEHGIARLDGDAGYHHGRRSDEQGHEDDPVEPRFLLHEQEVSAETDHEGGVKAGRDGNRENRVADKQRHGDLRQRGEEGAGLVSVGAEESRENAQLRCADREAEQPDDEEDYDIGPLEIVLFSPQMNDKQDRRRAQRRIAQMKQDDAGDAKNDAAFREADARKEQNAKGDAPMRQNSAVWSRRQAPPIRGRELRVPAESTAFLGRGMIAPAEGIRV